MAGTAGPASYGFVYQRINFVDSVECLNVQPGRVRSAGFYLQKSSAARRLLRAILSIRANPLAAFLELL